MNVRAVVHDEIPLGVGFYTLADAARLIGSRPRTIRRWMAGYTRRDAGTNRFFPPLWSPQLPRVDGEVEIGFRDLIELRFVHAFVQEKLSLATIRHCLEYARICVQDDRPFSTRRFRTDGRTIFLEGLSRSGEAEVLNLKNRQYEFRQIIARTFRDLDIEDDVVARWRPYDGKSSIVIDPTRSFGKPIAAASGVPTAALADAVRAEGTVERAARVFEVPPGVVRDALSFEERLGAP